MRILIILTFVLLSPVDSQPPVIVDPPTLHWSHTPSVGPTSYVGVLAFGVVNQTFIGLDGNLISRGYLGFGVDPGCGPWPDVLPIQTNIISQSSISFLEDCFKLCVMNSRCACYGFRLGTCWLYSNCQGLINSSQAVTGLVRESIWSGVATPLPPSFTPAPTVNDCSDLCRTNLRCNFYSFNNSQCTLLTNVTPDFVTQDGATFGAMCRGFTIPGPTITVNRGGSYYMTLLNTLHPQTQGVINTIRDANITNIHAHGLHISPIAPSNDMEMMANGGECLPYIWNIPSSHMGGTMWWHPLHHGSSNTQVGGGALGMLIVNDDPMDGTPQQIINMKTRNLVIQAVHAANGETLLSQSSIGRSFFLVNGNFQGTIVMPANTWERWRILYANSQPVYDTLSFPQSCTILLLAQDGVWRSNVPYVLPKPKPYPTVNVTGASRLDLAVNCDPSSGTLSIGSTLLANILIIENSNQSTPNIFPSWSPTFPTYLNSNLLFSNPNTTQNVSIIIKPNAIQVNHDTTPFNPSNPKIVIDDDSDIQIWNVTALTTDHPFHVHVNHFLMAEDCGDFRKGEYYDVMVTNTPCTILYVPYFSGNIFMHCQNLIQEDQGSITFATVLTGPGGPSSSANTPNTCSMFPAISLDVEDYEGDGLSTNETIFIIIIVVLACLFIIQSTFLIVVGVRWWDLVVKIKEIDDSYKNMDFN